MAIIRRNDTDRGLVRNRGLDPFEMMQDLLRWDPFRELSRGVVGGTEVTNFIPAFEVKETKDSYVFKADLPGIKEDGLDISLTGNRLTISGQRQEEKKDEGDRHFVYERSFGSFSRSFTLPEGIDVDHVQAELKDGVLNVVVPKKPEVQPKRILVKGPGEGEKAKA
ncbi:Hsp20/alpha crystallin family protein [Archangium violaceum]|uniref:Hsp20/alpha crystallin family protein n=1 Tax=Archangium violaceum TaxID=83451 RepID=UPI00193C863C|nr:Hsp20/alpha crystallin family protein [Archangium violaceum]QRK06307.1 Hsp20/alpha crystallin family protein [Archangium violaceum]